MIPIPIDTVELLQGIGAYAYNPSTHEELAEKLQRLQGAPADRLFEALELLYAFRDALGEAGLTLLGQIAGHASQRGWVSPRGADRFERVYRSVQRDLGEPGDFDPPLEDPEPHISLRLDYIDWRQEAEEPNLSLRKAALWRVVKRLRDEHEDGVAPTPVGGVQADDRSKIKISGLVQMALIAQSMQAPFEEEFTLADNSVVMLNAQMAIGLGVAVGRYVSGVHLRARQLRTMIDAAETAEELEGIDIGAEWP